MIYDYETREELKKLGINPDTANLPDNAEDQSANVS